MIGMTVRELREALADLPDDMVVVIACDAEGNGYSPLVEIAESMYHAETEYSGETYPTPEEIADTNNQFTEEDEAPDGAVRVATLWPVN